MDIEHPLVLNILRRSMVARLATLSRNGRPSVNSLYFLYRDGRIWLGTADWTLAAHNVEANPEVCLLLELEQDAPIHHTLRLSGRAWVREDPETVHSYGLGVVHKYVLTGRGLRNALAHFRQLRLQSEYRAQSKRKGRTCVIEFTPQQVELLTNGHPHC
jgi:general stress protein 26